jgi:hypothetical protein
VTVAGRCPITVKEPSSSAFGGNDLAQWRVVVVVVRLTLGPTGELSHGEIVDASNRVQGRFATWTDLVPTVRAWLQGEAGESPEESE